MPIRPTVTSIEALVMTKVKSFLEERSAQLASAKSSSPKEGTDMIAEAIAMGIAEAFKSPAFDTEAALIIDTNAAAVVPVGTAARSAFKAAALAPVVPNPNLSNPY